MEILKWVYQNDMFQDVIPLVLCFYSFSQNFPKGSWNMKFYLKVLARFLLQKIYEIWHVLLYLGVTITAVVLTLIYSPPETDSLFLRCFFILLLVVIYSTATCLLCVFGWVVKMVWDESIFPWLNKNWEVAKDHVNKTGKIL
jgi:hypothetical protein